MASSIVKFGPIRLKSNVVFFESALSRAFVNLKPIVPGHVLVTPKRVIDRFTALSPEEVTDLWASVHQIAPVLEKHYGCDALNLAIQDGMNSGQSVPHVHVHILPRKAGDFQRNDGTFLTRAGVARMRQIWLSFNNIALCVLLPALTYAPSPTPLHHIIHTNNVHNTP